MPDQQKITEYIENLKFKKSLCRGFQPEEVNKAICTLSSMYNEVLSETCMEMDALKAELELVKQNADADDAPAIIENDENAEIPEAQEEVAAPVEEKEETGFGFDEDDEDEDAVEDAEEIIKDAPAEANEDAPAEENKAEEPENEIIRVSDNKKLQKLKRGELLQLLAEQNNENLALRNQLATVKAENESLAEKLADRKIKIDKAGTLAEAALAINGVIDSAHEAAKQYLENLEDLCRRQAETVEMKEAKVRESTKMMVDEATRKSDEMLQSAEDKCSAMTIAAQERCDNMRAEANSYCQMIKRDTLDKCNEERHRAEALYVSKVKEFEADFVEKEKVIIERCERKERETERACAEMVAKAQMDVEARWEILSTRLEEFYNAHAGLRELLEASDRMSK